MPLGTEIGLGPSHGKGHGIPHFRPMSIVATRSSISASAELLYKRSSTRSPAIAEGPRDAGVPVEIW